MNRITILLVVNIAILINSCEYDPGGVYNRHVNKDVSPPQLQTIELNLENDSIYLYADMLVSFRFTSNNQEIHNVRLLVDESEIGIVNSDNGKFNISCWNLEQGDHKLVMEVFTGSGTGSIADSIGAEGYLFTKSWVLTIDKSYFLEASTSIKNGLLQLSWTKYKASDFKEYIVYRNVSFNGEKEIARGKVTEFTDSSYVGETVQYIVKVNTKDDDIFSSRSINLNQDLPQIYYSVEDSNRYIARWTKSKYYNAVDTVLILLANALNYQDERRVKWTSNMEDTVYNVTDACFGDEIILKLRLIPRKTNLQYTTNNYYNFESQTWGKLGFSIPYLHFMTDYHAISNDEFAYIMGCDSIIRYSVSQKRVVDRLGYQLTACSTCKFVTMEASPKGKYLTAHVGCDHDIMVIEGENYKNNSITVLQAANAGIPYAPVSDIGTCLVKSNFGGFNVYDFINSKTLGFYSKDYYDYNAEKMKISSTGEFIFVSDDSLRLVQFKNSVFNDLWKVPRSNNIKFYEFDPVNTNQVVFWNGSVLSVKNCDNLSAVYEFTLSDSYLLDIDYTNNEILTFSSGHLYIRSYTNGSLLKDIPVNIKLTNWPSTCYLINHTIVFSDGLLYFIY